MTEMTSLFVFDLEHAILHFSVRRFNREMYNFRHMNVVVNTMGFLSTVNRK